MSTFARSGGAAAAAAAAEALLGVGSSLVAPDVLRAAVQAQAQAALESPLGAPGPFTVLEAVLAVARQEVRLSCSVCYFWARGPDCAPVRVPRSIFGSMGRPWEHVTRTRVSHAPACTPYRPCTSLHLHPPYTCLSQSEPTSTHTHHTHTRPRPDIALSPRRRHLCPARRRRPVRPLAARSRRFTPARRYRAPGA